MTVLGTCMRMVGKHCRPCWVCAAAPSCNCTTSSLPQIYDMLPEDQRVQRQRRVQHTEAVIAGTGAVAGPAGRGVPPRVSGCLY